MTTKASRDTLLRTTADLVERAAQQLSVCAEEWPAVHGVAKAVGAAADELVEMARAVGYVAKVRRS